MSQYIEEIILTVKDSRWLTLEVCREYLRGDCNRREEECKFAHVLQSSRLDIRDGRVICCYDFLKNRCVRGSDKPCRYFHPPGHLCDQLVQNGRNNLLMKNIPHNLMHQYIKMVSSNRFYTAQRTQTYGEVPSVAITRPKAHFDQSYFTSYNIGFPQPTSPYATNQLKIIPQYTPPMPESKLHHGISSPTNYSHSSCDISPPIEDLGPLPMFNSNCFALQNKADHIEQMSRQFARPTPYRKNNFNQLQPAINVNHVEAQMNGNLIPFEKNVQWLNKTGCYNGCLIPQVFFNQAQQFNTLSLPQSY